MLRAVVRRIRSQFLALETGQRIESAGRRRKWLLAVVHDAPASAAQISRLLLKRERVDFVCLFPFLSTPARTRGIAGTDSLTHSPVAKHHHKPF